MFLYLPLLQVGPFQRFLLHLFLLDRPRGQPLFLYLPRPFGRGGCLPVLPFHPLLPRLAFLQRARKFQGGGEQRRVALAAVSVAAGTYGTEDAGVAPGDAPGNPQGSMFVFGQRGVAGEEDVDGAVGRGVFFGLADAVPCFVIGADAPIEGVDAQGDGSDGITWRGVVHGAEVNVSGIPHIVSVVGEQEIGVVLEHLFSKAGEDPAGRYGLLQRDGAVEKVLGGPGDQESRPPGMVVDIKDGVAGDAGIALLESGGAAGEAFADAPELCLGLLQARSVDEEGHGGGFHGAVHVEGGHDDFADGVEGVDAVAMFSDGIVFVVGTILGGFVEDGPPALREGLRTGNVKDGPGIVQHSGFGNGRTLHNGREAKHFAVHRFLSQIS
mmetsp:Transcript_17749/g.40221  ORF Transcript_17749/g.40221 Transcript_17749/m.40221 type:complete len:382 (+) Transcript_17749:1750-2895(+)